MKKRFSERNNMLTAKEILAPEMPNSPFRKSIFDTLYNYFMERDPGGREWNAVNFNFQREVMERTLDEIDYDGFYESVSWIKPFILTAWKLHQIFDLLEIILDTDEVYDELRETLEAIFENDQIEFYLDKTNKIISPKLTQQEAEAIKSAFGNLEKFPAPKQHLDAAIHMFSAGKYSKSIAESVHAVESLIRKLTKDDKAEIPEGLKKLNAISPIHGAFSGAINKLYAYAGDVPGARHSAISTEESASKEDAQFVLVTSAAFITYLMDKFGEVEEEQAA